MCLIDFTTATLDEITAEVERMLHAHHAPRRNYAARTPQPPAASEEIASLPRADPGVAGTYSEDVA